MLPAIEQRTSKVMALPLISHVGIYFQQQAFNEVREISELTTNRLSVYLRCLITLSAAGIKTVSSQGWPSSSISIPRRSARTWVLRRVWRARRWYFVEELQANITKILAWTILMGGIIGAGNLVTLWPTITDSKNQISW